MTWINEHIRLWRTAVLLLLILAITGPWIFDKIWVPAEYICRPPNFRIDQNYCGLPIPGIRFFFFVISNFFLAISSMVIGGMAFLGFVRELLFSALFLLFLLPLVTTFSLILRGNNQSKFAILIWGLAAGVGLFVGLSNNSRQIWLVWGIWLYIGLALITLMLELILFKFGGKSTQLPHLPESNIAID
jgi:hypothetical protein